MIEVVSFPSDGETCVAWHLGGEGDAFASERGRPCVVMAAGMGGTKDSGLLPFAEAFAGVGLDAFLFDYRGFGESGGEPRQLAWPPRHREDLREAVDCARSLDGVDSDRIVLWGWSWGASHAIQVAAADPESIAALVAMTPDADGIGTMRQLLSQRGPRQMLRLIGAATRDLVGSARGRPPELIPTVGPPGSLAALTAPDCEPGYKAVGGPGWRNEVAARVALAECLNRSIRHAGRLSCPILIQGAISDSVAHGGTARRLAWEAKGRSELREYPGSHFDLLLGERDRAIEHQLHFLRRHLSVSAEVAASTLKA